MWFDTALQAWVDQMPTAGISAAAPSSLPTSPSADNHQHQQQRHARIMSPAQNNTSGSNGDDDDEVSDVMHPRVSAAGRAYSVNVSPSTGRAATTSSVSPTTTMTMTTMSSNNNVMLANGGSDWTFDTTSGMLWSQSLQMYYHEKSKSFGDPRSGRWFDTASGVWR
jgi:hypothetical protein